MYYKALHYTILYSTCYIDWAVGWTIWGLNPQILAGDRHLSFSKITKPTLLAMSYSVTG